VDRDPGHGPDGSAEPLVSVVVAAYNAARYIGDTCRSVLNQTYRSLELIVVDDGSTDATGNIVDALVASDPRVRLIRQRNLGVAAARNRALAAASGEFIAPLDADDLWDPTKIERQVRRLQECGPGTGLVYCWWAWIDGTGAVLDRSPPWREEGQVLQRLIEVNFTGNASVPLYRRSLIEELGGYDAGLRDNGCQGCEDWDLVLRIAGHCAVAVVPAVLVAYRRLGDSMSANCMTMWNSRARVMSALAARFPSIPAETFRRSTSQFALHLAGVAYWSGDYLQAMRWGLRVRPPTIALAVLPYIVRLLGCRFLRPRTPVRLTGESRRFEEHCLPAPLMPYHRMLARRWRSQERRASAAPGSATR